MRIGTQLAAMFGLAALTAMHGYSTSLIVVGAVDAALLIINRIGSGRWMPVRTVGNTMLIISLAAIPVVGALLAIVVLAASAGIRAAVNAAHEMTRARRPRRH